MGRFAVLLYGLIAYVIFLATFLYAMGFVEGYVVPKNIDTGTDGPIGMAILTNVALLGLFAVQHTIMARPAFKARWTKLIHPAIERSTFVLATCVCLALMFWLWQPMNSVMWQVEHSVWSKALLGVSLLGWGVVLYSSFLIDHFDLFGVRHVVLHFQGREYTHHPFMEKSLYKLIRHPLMTGFIIAFWATPNMTAGHLLFAIVTTTYIVALGIRIEEHDLVNFLGDDYHRYRLRTPMLIPRPWGRRPESEIRSSSGVSARPEK
jgi:protein-S-isoprenylcysteine O-methyltransferase Ste14